MTEQTNRRFLLVRRPVGDPLPDDFALVHAEMPQAPPGSFVVRNHYASLDPAQRGWMDDAPSYVPPMPLQDAVRATTVGQVHSSKCEGFAPGDWVLGMNAIEDYTLVTPNAFTSKIDVSRVAPTHYLYALGAVGLTAYFGLLEVGKPKAGEKVLVSAAAGAVGSLVGQIAKIHGCRAIGVAGGSAKCARLIERYGYDAAIDYRGKSRQQLVAEIAAAAPNGVNIVFENVGGDVLDASLMNLAPQARILLCGLISEYNSASGKIGARNIWQLIVKRARMQGFLVSDYLDRFPAGQEDMIRWLAEGRLKADEHIEKGIENAYSAFTKLFSGRNEGKLILQMA
jgi:NADPH-dependent curcumin reductase CurA